MVFIQVTVCLYTHIYIYRHTHTLVACRKDGSSHKLQHLYRVLGKEVRQGPMLDGPPSSRGQAAGDRHSLRWRIGCQPSSNSSPQNRDLGSDPFRAHTYTQDLPLGDRGSSSADVPTGATLGTSSTGRIHPQAPFWGLTWMVHSVPPGSLMVCSICAGRFLRGYPPQTM